MKTPEAKLAYNREYRKRNKERIAVQSRAYRERNKEAIRERCRAKYPEYYKKHRVRKYARERVRRRERYRTDPEYRKRRLAQGREYHQKRKERDPTYLQKMRERTRGYHKPKPKAVKYWRPRTRKPTRLAGVEAKAKPKQAPPHIRAAWRFANPNSIIRRRFPTIEALNRADW